MNHAMSLSRVLFQMLEGEQEDMQALDRALLQYGWTAKDDYFCVCFFPEERDIHTNSVQYFCSRLMDHFPDSCAFLYEKCVVMLVNSTLSDMNPGSFGNRIAVMLREGLMKAGISALSSDLQMFSLYYEQAVCAYETGKKSTTPSGVIGSKIIRWTLCWKMLWKNCRLLFVQPGNPPSAGIRRDPYR